MGQSRMEKIPILSKSRLEFCLKTPIVYFSRSGSTELLASKIQALSGADVIELVAKETYSSDYGETVQRAN